MFVSVTEQSFGSGISLTWTQSFRYLVFFALVAHYIVINSIHTDFKVYITVIILIFHLCQIVHMASGIWSDISSLPGLQTCQCCNSMCYFNCYTQKTAQHWDPQRPCLVIFEVLQRSAGFMEGASPPAYRSPVIIEWKTSSVPVTWMSPIILTDSLRLMCSFCSVFQEKVGKSILLSVLISCC